MGSQTPSDSEDLSGLDSNSDSEDDDDNSLNDFVVQDDQSLNRPPTGASNSSGPHEAINLVSDDESDEGGAISNRRPRHRVHSNRSPVRLGSMSDRGFTPSESSDIHYGHQYGPGSPARTRSPSALTVTDTDTNISEAGSAELLRQSGWSPLDHGNDSDAEGPISPYGYQHGRYGSLDTDDEDDSETVTPVQRQLRRTVTLTKMTALVKDCPRHQYPRKTDTSLTSKPVLIFTIAILTSTEMIQMTIHLTTMEIQIWDHQETAAAEAPIHT